MASTKFVTSVFISCCILLTNAANTCHFDFSVPGVGPSCEMKGGLPSALIDKYEELFGGVQGLKLIVDDKKGLSKLIQDEFSKIQREQQIYSQNINQIANNIQAVKHMLGIFPIDPPESEQNINKEHIAKRAIDPYRALRNALHVAELELANMTRNMEETARRRSMAFSTMEQRVQQQDLRLMTVLKKISDLEKQAAKLPGSPQVASGGISSSSFNTILNIATISAKIQSTTEIIQARVADLNERLREMDKPIQKRKQNYQILNNNLKHLQSGVSKLTTDAASLRTRYNKFKNDLTQDFAPIQRDMTQSQQKYQTVNNDYSDIQTKLQKEDAKRQQDKQTLQQASASITRLKTTLTSFDPTMKNITNGITAIKQDPLVQLAQLLTYETTKMQKLGKDIKQTDTLGNTVKNMIKAQQAKLANIQTG